MKRSCPSTFASSSSSSSKPRIRYDVFLSFRGEDTRTSFTSHLYKSLCDKGIYTFLDDDKLERGKSISSELFKAIESSCCSIIVLSGNYASSSWCLDEVVKIVQCMKDYEQIVLPIFYYVDPTDVRKQEGIIGEAFETDKLRSHGVEKVKSWRDALTQVANLGGWHLRNGDIEAKVIQDIIVHVSKRLGDKQSNISRDLVSFCKLSKDLVGMVSRLEKLDLYVCPTSADDVRFIGICGMGGIGKTTLARAYYKWKSCEFESSSFVANVREVCEKEKNGLAYLKNLLLSHLLDEEPTKIRDTYKGMDTIKNRLRNKKLLIILDDVDKEDQLEELVGEDDWLSSGSRVLITTRNEGLLTFKDCTIYRAEQLNESDGLQLFYRKAFKTSHPLDNFRELSKRAIAYAKGLPLALKVLGSLLRDKTTNEWESAFLRLKEYPEEEIVKVLRITFDELKETEKNIFLDIACFFNGFDEDEIIQIMDRCHFHGTIGIRTLIDKSLVSKGPDNKIWMHDLLQEMGKEIVREKSRNEPGRWSRIWDYNDLCHVLDKNTGTEEVEAIVCSFSKAKKSGWEAFSNMKKLRLLFINFPPSGDDLPPIAYLSNELRILKWSGFPYRNLPSSFQLDGLVELILHYSNIEQLWNNSIKPLCNLKILDLKCSKFLTKFEDFKMVPNLEKLILEDCDALVEVHPSITLLRSLTLLNLKNCDSLKYFPTSINGLQSLKFLKLPRCTILGNLLDGSEELYVDFNVPPSGFDLASIAYLSKKLRILEWSGFPFPNLPSNFQPDGLVELILHCSNIKQLWNNSIKPLYNLKIIDLSGSNNFRKFEDFKVAPNLEKLILESCEGLVEVHQSVTLLRSLTLLNLNNCASLENFPTSINGLQSLKVLILSNCIRLRNLPKDLGHLKSLEELYLDFNFPPDGFDLQQIAYLYGKLRILKWSRFPFPNLPSISFHLADGLVELILHYSNIEQLWNNSMPLNNLKIIDLSGSNNFRKFEDFKVVPNLEKLILQDCKGLVEVHSSISLLRRLTLLNLKNCTSLENLPRTINDLESLEVLQLSYCKSLRILPEDLGNLNSLNELHLYGTCVAELPSSIASLKNLKIVFALEYSASVGKRLPISGRLDSLKEANLGWCGLGDGAIPEDFGCLAFLEDVKLNSNDFSYLPACFNRLTKLRNLDLRGCKNLKSLGPELPPSLEIVWVDRCISLDTFLDPLNDQYCNLRCSATCMNCFELVKRQGSKRTAFGSLKRYLQNPPNPSKRFDIVLPGNEIPAWFTHQSSGMSISFQLDPNLCNGKWIGFAISVCPIKWGWSSNCKIIRIDGQDWGFGRLVESPEVIRYNYSLHPWLWLFYLPRDIYFQTNELQYNNCSARIEFSFENNTKYQFGWGVRLVCEQDIHDLNLHSEDEDLDIRYLLQNKYGYGYL